MRYILNLFVMVVIVLSSAGVLTAGKLDWVSMPTYVRDYQSCVRWFEQNKGNLAYSLCRRLGGNELACQGARLGAGAFLFENDICDFCRRNYPGEAVTKKPQYAFASKGKRTAPEYNPSDCSGNCFNGWGRGPWNGQTYVGRWKDGKPHGKGSLYGDYSDKNTEVYKGQWKNGFYHGFGTLYGAGRVKRYRGNFKEDKYHGSGALYYDDGKIQYKGQWKEGKRNGRGTSYHANGKRNYTGKFLNDVEEGQGTMYMDNGKLLYRGQFHDGQFQGKGIRYDESGKGLHKGQWDMGSFIGTGKKEASQSEAGVHEKVYAGGDFGGLIGASARKKKMAAVKEENPAEIPGSSCIKGNCRNGKGKGIWENLIYKGSWKNSQPNGTGALYYPDGSTVYRGGFMKGVYHGQGTLYENGVKKYKGRWKKGNYSGKGRSYFDNGKIEFSGSFKEGMRDGFGIWYYYDGKTRYKGHFRLNQFHGKGTEYDPEGIVIYSGKWSMGEREQNQN